MAVYLAADEGKLGFWPVCLPAINLSTQRRAASHQPRRFMLLLTQMSGRKHVPSVWTFLGCCTWEELMKQSGALWEQPCFCGSWGFPSLEQYIRGEREGGKARQRHNRETESMLLPATLERPFPTISPFPYLTALFTSLTHRRTPCTTLWIKWLLWCWRAFNFSVSCCHRNASSRAILSVLINLVITIQAPN